MNVLYEKVTMNSFFHFHISISFAFFSNRFEFLLIELGLRGSRNEMHCDQGKDSKACPKCNEGYDIHQDAIAESKFG